MASASAYSFWASWRKPAYSTSGWAARTEEATSSSSLASASSSAGPLQLGPVGGPDGVGRAAHRLAGVAEAHLASLVLGVQAGPQAAGGLAKAHSVDRGTWPPQGAGVAQRPRRPRARRVPAVQRPAAPGPAPAEAGQGEQVAGQQGGGHGGGQPPAPAEHGPGPRPGRRGHDQDQQDAAAPGRGPAGGGPPAGQAGGDGGRLQLLARWARWGGCRWSRGGRRRWTAATRLRRPRRPARPVPGGPGGPAGPPRSRPRARTRRGSQCHPLSRPAGPEAT